MKTLKHLSRYLVLPAATAVLFMACKKDTVPQEEMPLIKKVTVTENGGSPSVTTYMHENGKLKSVSYTNGNSTVYRYTTDSVIQSGFNAASQPLYTAASKLNSKGLALSITQFDVNGVITHAEIYDFNSDNRRSRATVTTYPYPAEYNYYYTGNRMDSFVYTANNKVLSRKIAQEVAADITNTIGNANFGTPYVGNSPLLTKKNTSYYYSSAGILNETIQYTSIYETNSKGQVVKQTETGISSVSGTNTRIYEYAYY